MNNMFFKQQVWRRVILLTFCWLAAAVLFVFTASHVGADPSDDDLVSNFDYASDGTSNEEIGGSSNEQWAQRFHTGYSPDAGFTLSGTKIIIATANTTNTGTEGIVARLYGSKFTGCSSGFNGNCPDTSSLLATGTLASTDFDAADETGEKTITFSSAADVDENKYYWIVLVYQPSAGTAEIKEIHSNDQDGVSSGWFIDNASFSTSSTNTTTQNDQSLGIAVIGRPKNSDAEGDPTIDGNLIVGQTLTADTSGITDDNGLTSPSYTYQWVRQDNASGGNVTNISGQTSSTYTTVAADNGKYIKVVVSFDDDDTYSETLTSDAVGPITTFGVIPGTVDTSATGSGTTFTFDIAGLNANETPTISMTSGSCRTNTTLAQADNDDTTDDEYTIDLLASDGSSSLSPGTYSDCQATITRADGSTTANVTIPEFTALNPPPNFSATVADKTYYENVALSTGSANQLPEIDATTGEGSITYSLTATTSDGTLSANILPAGITFTPGTRRMAGTPTAAGTYTMTYTAEDSAPTARTISLTFTVTVNEFSITITDDTTGPEQEKTVTADGSDSGTSNWGAKFISGTTCDATAYAGGDTITDPSTFESSSEPVTVTAKEEGNNGKRVCFKTDYGGTTFYQISGAITGIDTTPPSGATITLASVVSDGYLNSSEASGSSNLLSSAASFTDTNTVSYEYAVALSSTTCDSSLTYSASIPDASDVPSTDGTYYVCVEATDAADNTAYGSSSTFVRDTEAPSVSGTPTVTVVHNIGNPGVANYAVVGDTIDLRFTVSEELASTPSADIAGDTATVTKTALTGYAATITVTSSTDEDLVDFSIGELTDPAGNTSVDPSKTGTDSAARIDIAAPGITAPSLINDVADDYLNLDESDDSDDLIGATTVTDAVDTSPALSYAVIADSAACDSTASFSSGIPHSNDVTGADGDYKVCIKAADDAGNIAYEATASFTKDTTPPEAPTGLDLHEDDDTYADINENGSYDAGTDFGSNSDNHTSKTSSITISYTQETDIKAKLYVNSTMDIEDPSFSSGTSGTNDLTTLIAGDYAITATATDRAGNESAHSIPLDITIDTTDPQTLTTDLQTNSDMGAADDDNYTNSEALTFDIAGNTNSDELYTVLFKDGSSLHAEVTAGAGLSSATGTLTHDTGGSGDGDDVVFTVMAFDEAGNTSESAGETVYLDYSVATPTLTRRSSDDLGASDSDGITNAQQFGFSIGSIETETTNRGNGAEVILYNGDPEGTGAAVATTPEIGRSDAAVTAASHDDIVTDKSDFSDGKHDFYVCQTDDAGNTACTTTAVSWIVDTQAPPAPQAPDLHADDDSYGENANGARDGTNNDDLTKNQNSLDFASGASGSEASTVCIGATCAHDQHQIRFYLWSDTNADNIADDSELTQLKQPTGSGTDNVRGTGNISTINDADYTYNTARGTEKELYSSSDTLGEGTHRFVAKQYDIAGNLSAVSAHLEIEVDITQPDALTTQPNLHQSTDTGESSTDHETSNAQLIITFTGTPMTDDIDYFEVRRARLTDEFETATSFSYPSDSDSVQQTSYEYLRDTETRADFIDETADTYGEGAYQRGDGTSGSTGGAIEITAMDIPAYNTWYGFKVFAVDKAGNVRRSVNGVNIRILVPPPVPSGLNLAAADDTSRDDLTDGDSDDITSDTTWTLSGQFQNTTSQERTNDAAGGVAEVEITIAQLNEHGQEVEEKTVSVSSFTRPSGSSANDPYAFSTSFNTSAFASITDGTYSVTAIAKNSGGEGSSASDALEIILDRQAPTPETHLTIRSDRYGTGTDTVVHSLTLTDASSSENDGAFVLHKTDGNTETVAVDENVEIRSTNSNFVADLSYEVEYVDAAGNTSGTAELLTVSKPPTVTSYETDTNKYIVIASPQDGSALSTDVKQFNLQTSSTCNPEGTRGSGGSETAFTLGTIVTETSDYCIEVKDTNNNRTVVRLKADKNDLIANSGVVSDDDTGRSSSDSTTNNANPRYTGTTLPGSTVRIQTKLSTETWGDSTLEHTVTADGETGAFEIPSVLTAAATADSTVNLRGYVTNTDTLGADEIGPIALTDVTIDLTAPTAPTMSFDGADDSGDLNTDLITSQTTDLTFTVTGEGDGKVTLSTGETDTIASESTSVDIDISLAEGTHAVTATQEDVAGNTSPASSVSTLIIDTTDPDITIVRLNDSDTTIDADTEFIAVAQDAVSVTFKTTDSLSDCTSVTSLTGTAYTEGEIFDPSDTSAGVCFAAQDAAGNFAVKHTDDAIEGVGNVEITGSTKDASTYITRSGSREITGITASNAKVLIKIADAADTPGSYTDAQLQDTSFADLVFDMPSDQTSFTQTLSIASGDDGKKLAGWIWTDKDDKNTSTPAIEIGTLTVDNTAPTGEVTTAIASDNSQNASFAKQGDTLSVGITVNERLQSITATIAGEDATCDAVPTDPATEISCEVALSNDAHEGKAVFAYTITDRAGNETSNTASSSVTVDATAPTVTIDKIARKLFKTNEEIALTVTLTDTNEINPATYTLTAGSGITLSACAMTVSSGQRSAQTSCTATVTAATDGSDLTVTIPQTEDAPGNTKASHSVSLGRLDTTAPTLSTILSQDDSKTKRFTFSIEAAHNQHTDNQSITETVYPVFGGDCEKFTTEEGWTAETPDSTTYTYSLTVKAQKGKYDACTLQLKDEAGNTSSDTLTFEAFTIKSGGGIARLGNRVLSGITSFIVESDVVSFLAGGREEDPGTREDPQQITAQPETSYQFTRDLTTGSTGEDVRQLQIFLNTNGYTVAETGAGSSGQETAYFGERTRQALARYQGANGITPANGYFGSVTRARVNGQGTPPPADDGTGGTETNTGNEETGYQFGDSHPDIREAQQLLNQTDCPVAETGAGSSGQETEYFGSKTRQAVICYQRENSLTITATITQELLIALREDVTPSAGTDSTGTDNAGTDNNDGSDTSDSGRDTGETETNTGNDGYVPITQPFTVRRPTGFSAPTF